MKQQFTFIFLAILFMGSSILKAELKIGVIDNKKVLLKYSKAQKHFDKILAQKNELEKEAKEKRESVEVLFKEFNDLKKKLETSASALGKKKIIEIQAQLQKKLGVLRQKDVELREFVGKGTEKISKTDQEGRYELLKDVRKAIQNYAKEEKFDFVLEYSSYETKAQTIWYAGDKFDITDTIIQILGKEIEEVSKIEEGKKD